MSKQRLVVIGNGMAGARTVEEILGRGGGEQFEIVMFGDEPYGNYNRILLSEVLSGKQEQGDIVLNELEWYAANGVTLHAGERVVAIDRLGKQVRSAKGTSHGYDKLLIATGSRPWIPPASGMQDENGAMLPGVLAFRTVDDCSAILNEARSRRKVAVIGAGLLGLEAARGLLTHGCEVHIVHLAARLMELQLDDQAAGLLQTAMEAMGAVVHLKKTTTAVLRQGDQVEGLAFKDGSTLPCDLVIVAAGIRPNSEIGRHAGLSVGRGIIVDDQMRSIDDPCIYAVGECAEHRGKLYGLLAPLWEQAKVAADHLTGADAKAVYQGSKLATKLKVAGAELASMGMIEPADPNDEVVQVFEPRRGTYKKLIIRDNRLIGAIVMGDLAKAGYLMQTFDRDTPLPEERLSLLFDLDGPAKEVPVADLPDDSQVCHCNGVSKQAIRACVDGGNRTATAVMDATRAGKGCGSCKAVVTRLVDHLLTMQAEDPSAQGSSPATLTSTPAGDDLPVLTIAGARADPLHEDAALLDAARAIGARLLNWSWKEALEDLQDPYVFRERRDGIFSVVAEMPDGRTTPEQLRRIADVAERHGVPQIKVIDGVGLKDGRIRMTLES